MLTLANGLPNMLICFEIWPGVLSDHLFSCWSIRKWLQEGLRSKPAHIKQLFAQIECTDAFFLKVCQIPYIYTICHLECRSITFTQNSSLPPWAWCQKENGSQVDMAYAPNVYSSAAETSPQQLRSLLLFNKHLLKTMELHCTKWLSFSKNWPVL